MSDSDDFGYLLQRAAKQYRVDFAIELRSHNLTPQQAAVLIAVAESPHRSLAPGSVAELIGADPATTTGLLQRLERDGWLSSATNPGDGRSRLLSLTSRAEQTVPSLMNLAQLVSARAGDALSPDELGTLVSLLRRVIDKGTDAAQEVRR